MKKVVTILTVAAALLFAGNAHAQLGVHLGYSPETWTTGDDNTDLTSIVAGVHYNMPLAADLKVAVGGQLRYSFLSGEKNFYGMASVKQNTSLFAIEVPILLNYGLDLTNDLRFTVFAGPKVSYYVAGKTTFEGNVLGISGNGEEKWFDEEGLVQNNPLNLSLSFGVAFSYNQFSLYGGYNMGMMDMERNDNTTTKINGLFVGLGMEL